MSKHRVILPDGEVRWQSWTDQALFNEKGEIVEYQSVGRDITEIIQAEETGQMAKRKLTLLSRITRHDILNQITILKCYLDQAREEPDHTDLSDLIMKLDRVSQNIESQIACTREYEDIGVKVPVWQNVHEILSKILKSFEFSAVSVRCDVGTVEVFADPLLERVFYNIVENALRHGMHVTSLFY